MTLASGCKKIGCRMTVFSFSLMSKNGEMRKRIVTKRVGSLCTN